MAGTLKGGQKASTTNQKRHGSDFYKKLGAIGGKWCSPTKGFGGNRERARAAGQMGGRISRRTWTQAQRDEQSKRLKQLRERRREAIL